MADENILKTLYRLPKSNEIHVVCRLALYVFVLNIIYPTTDSTIYTLHIERTIDLIQSVSVNTLTCGQLSVVKLANSVRFEPCHSVSEMSIENRKLVLRQQPRTADVHLEKKSILVSPVQMVLLKQKNNNIIK